MQRREMFRMIWMVPAAFTSSPKLIVRPSVECDLCVVSLLQAMGMVGKGPYVLRVSPQESGWARRTLSRAFRSPERYADFTITSVPMEDSAGWTLDNGRRMFVSRGA